MQPYQVGVDEASLVHAIRNSLCRDGWIIDGSDNSFSAELQTVNGVISFVGSPFKNGMLLLVNGHRKEISFVNRFKIFLSVRKEFKRRLLAQRAEMKESHLDDAFYVLRGSK